MKIQHNSQCFVTWESDLWIKQFIELHKNVKRKKKDAVQRNRENLLNRIQIQFNSEYNQAKRNESFNKNRGKT